MNRLSSCYFPSPDRIVACVIVALLATQLLFPSAIRAADAAFVEQPVIGRNADGTLEVFAVDAAGELRHRWQKPSTGDWSDWSRLGAGILPGIAVAEDHRGRMEVFAVDKATQTLRCIRQREPNGTEWSEWKNLGGAIRPPVAVGRDADGRLEVFAAAAGSNTVAHLWETDTNSSWSRWSNLGGAVLPELAVAQNNDGRLELFGIRPGDNSLVHCWQQMPNASTGWSEWENLGGAVLPRLGLKKSARGMIEVFAVNSTNRAVNRICQAVASDSRQWTSWSDFGPRVQPGITVAKTGSGRLEIFAVAAGDSFLLHRWEVPENGPEKWSAWKTVSKKIQSVPAVEKNEDGNLEIFAVDARENKIIHQRQIGLASGWLDWSTLDQQTPQYGSRLWQIDEGLPDNLVQAISQTTDGYLWVGTSAGLARFDGTQFLVFTPTNAPGLKNISITALCPDRDRALWIGTDGGGLTRMKDGEFVHFGTADGLAGDKVRVILQTKDGALWIGTESGLSRYQDGKFTNYTRANGLSSDIVHNLYEDKGGNLWIATSKSLNRLRPDGGIDSFSMPNQLPNDSVRAICQDKGGQIWIGSNNGLLWYNQVPGRGFYPYNTRYGLSDPFVSAICEDRDGNLWVGTYSGLNRFREGKFYGQLDSEGLPFDKVNALFEDRQGDLWVGTEQGLARLKPKSFVAYTRQNGLTHNNTTSVLQDRDGNYWIGTWGGGLDELKDEKITAYTSTNRFSRDLIISLCQGHDGSIWAGSDFDGGLTRLKNGSVTQYTWQDGLPKSGLRVLHEDATGTLWIGTPDGLFQFKNGKFNKFPDPAAGKEIHTIYEDHSGAIWVGSENGLSCWKDGTLAHFTTTNGLSDNAVLALFEDAAGALWIGTKAGGLDCLRDGKVTVYTSRNGLFSDEIFSIAEDNEGWLWMTCTKGVFRVCKADLAEFDKNKTGTVRCIAYGKSDGMESPECSGAGRPASWKDRDGRLWFPTSKGLVMVDPATLPAGSSWPAVYIDQVRAGQKRLIRDTQVLAPNPADVFPASAPLRIPPTRGELQFDYAALNLSSPEKCRFKYKLNGINREWVDAGARRAAYYNGIPPGSYEFRVIACNGNGVWSKTGATLHFVLRPFYWQTWWFKSLLAALVIGGASAVARYLTRRKMQHKLELLKQRHAIEKERNRIAKDIHDDLGSNLTRITMLGERVEEALGSDDEIGAHVRKIVTSARRTVQSLDEIVWAVNPENDTLESLVDYISLYSGEFFEGTGVRCLLEIPVQLPRCELSAELRHNLFLMIKEAFNNALKHSQATAVTVSVAATEDIVEIVITDNGRGFNLNGLSREQQGNGLVNLSRRMESLGGKLEVTTQPGSGTKLRFVVKLERQLRA